MSASRWRTGREVERLLRDGVDQPGGDARLLHRFLAERDESAFGAIVDRHGPMVLALCRRYLRDPADVDDAFQATFLVLVRKGGRLRDGAALSCWLHGVARRVAVRARADLLKRRAREGSPARLDAAVASPARGGDDAFEALHRELARLPEKYRAPLVLCHLEGRTYDQAAAELGWPPGTVRSRTARARALLQGRLTRLGVDAPACLALAKADPAAPLVPSSLVAATVDAAGRFVGPASSLATSAPWPAAALAQGVIATMFPSPWKLLGFAGVSVGLAAGAVAVAAGSLAPAAQDGAPEPQPPTAKPADPPAPIPVELRIDALEAKLDRIAEMLAKPATPLPARIVRQPRADVASTDDQAAPGPRSLREIEARLINGYQSRQLRQTLFERALISWDEVEAVVQQVRILLGRLLDMQDEYESAQRALEAAKKEVDELDQVRAVRWAQLKAVRGESYKTIEEQGEKVAAASRAIQEAEDRLASARRDVATLQRELRPLEEQSGTVRKLIAWTKEHFPDAKLTIEDLP
ncbi:sigma-70 family RNA polymerase sigma factor [Planctomyces sp. SH-PL62]|uniref:sigma-70 family RNA polymerase sigma factor n=1 Tax=Planctomyces sp. SH-PL62 TaxID=1636152 RepID=UPI00078B5C8D|nr:sigma-70 family RNA polymerase sigma factor [Planctomyces sp. SH-PL62]AMV37812.1 ECF RNA polymerase sigma-E factor [Planctomyces sp. SH-PL62]